MIHFVGALDRRTIAPRKHRDGEHLLALKPLYAGAFGAGVGAITISPTLETGRKRRWVAREGSATEANFPPQRR
ncbi:hypothetical protein MRX96_006617 [Rhipicephalus microplus]